MSAVFCLTCHTALRRKMSVSREVFANKDATDIDFDKFLQLDARAQLKALTEELTSIQSEKPIFPIFAVINDAVDRSLKAIALANLKKARMRQLIGRQCLDAVTVSPLPSIRCFVLTALLTYIGLSYSDKVRPSGLA